MVRPPARIGGGVTMRSRAAPFLTLLALAACSRPDWTDPERSKGPREPPPLTAAPRKGVPNTVEAVPAPPAWATAIIGRGLREAFPRSAACLGNTDNLTLIYLGRPPGIEVGGWGWDSAAKVHIGKVLLVDAQARIVGAGEGGRRRKDVPRVVPSIKALDTGWRAVTPKVAGALDVYGLTADGAVCGLGHIEY